MSLTLSRHEFRPLVRNRHSKDMISLSQQANDLHKNQPKSKTTKVQRAKSRILTRQPQNNLLKHHHSNTYNDK